MPNERECLEVMRHRGDRMLPRSCRLCGLGPCRRGFPAYKQPKEESMADHGGNEEIVGGDATPRDRVAKAAQEAFYDLQGGGAIMAARAHVAEAYEGEDRRGFEEDVAKAVGGLVDDLTGGEADQRGFVEGVTDAYDRRNAG